MTGSHQALPVVPGAGVWRLAVGKQAEDACVSAARKRIHRREYENVNVIIQLFTITEAPLRETHRLWEPIKARRLTDLRIKDKEEEHTHTHTQILLLSL